MTGFNVLLGIQMGYNSVWMLFCFKIAGNFVRKLYFVIFVAIFLTDMILALWQPS